MKIIKTSENLSTREKYMLTQDASAQKMTTVKGQQIELYAWALYSDEQLNKKTGELEPKEILSIMTPEHEVFSTNSDTFKRDFFNMIDMFAADNEKVEAVKVLCGTSQNGREFITCGLGDF